MSTEFLSVLHFIFTMIWSLFTCWYLPGTNVTPAELAIGCILAGWLLRHLQHLGGFDVSSLVPGRRGGGDDPYAK